MLVTHDLIDVPILADRVAVLGASCRWTTWVDGFTRIAVCGRLAGLNMYLGGPRRRAGLDGSDLRVTALADVSEGDRAAAVLSTGQSPVHRVRQSSIAMCCQHCRVD